MDVAQTLFSIKKQLTGPGFLSLALQGSGLAIRLGFMLALLQFSGQRLLGEYGLLVSIELVTIYLSGFEFHSFTTRRYALKSTPASLRRALASHGRMLMLSAPLAMGVAVLAIWFFEIGLSTFDLLMFLTIIFSGSIAQEANRFIILARSPVTAMATSFFRTAAWQPVALLFVSSSNALTFVIACWTAAAVLSTVWALWLLRSDLNWKTKTSRRYLMHGAKSSRGFYVVASATVLQGNLERFVLQSYLGPEAVGLFTFFQTIANALSTLVQSAVLNVALPSLLRGFGQKDPQRFVFLWRTSLKSVFVSLFVGFLILLSVIVIVFITSRQQYIPYIWILCFLLLGQVILVTSLPTQLAIYGAHHDKFLMRVSMLTLIITSIMSFLLVSNIGINGAVASQILGCIVISVARLNLFLRLKRMGSM